MRVVAPALLALVACSGLARSTRVAFRWPDEAPPNGRVEVRGAPEGALTVHVADAMGGPSMAGEVHRDGGVLVFQPRFPFARGVVYRATFRPADGGRERSVEASRPDHEERRAEPARVVAVHPGAERLPANLLRFYVQFSKPMARGESQARIRILEEDGREARDVLLALEDELWDSEGARLTLLLDPGRIKRGLQKRDELGPTLQPDRAYTLVVDAGWPDADGVPTEAGCTKRFRTTQDDRTSPDPAAWTLDAPRAGTREPLVLGFDEPVDRALAERVLTVHAHAGGRLAGEVLVSDDEATWTFVPREPWGTGAHTLEVPTILEDRAGNDLSRTFEVDLRASDGRQAREGPVRLPFEVR